MRRCGTCSACCRWPSVAEIDKSARTPCQHLEKQGFRCTIYADRPQACAKCRCTWIRGLGATKDRPGTCGILMDRHVTAWGYVLVAKQLERGAAMKPAGSNALRRAGRDSGMLVLVVDFEDTDMVIGAAGPKHLVENFQKETKGIPVCLGRVSEYVDSLVERVMKGLPAEALAKEGTWPGM